MAFRQEDRGSALVVERCGAVHQPAQGAGLGDQRCRADHEAQPHPRRQHLRQRPQIDHPPGAVHGFERTGIGLEPGLALVIILDQQHIVADGAGQQGALARLRHRYHGRAVIGGRDHRQGHAVERRAIGVDAAVIHRQQPYRAFGKREDADDIGRADQQA